MSQPKARGPGMHRMGIWVFTAVLGVLVYWLLGFVLSDIGHWPGPSYAELEERLMDQKLVGQSEHLRSQIEEVTRTIEDQRHRQTLLRDSTASSQQTMNQLLEMQRLSLQKDLKPSPDEQKALAEAEQLFLANQKQYQLLNEQIVQLSEQLQKLEQEQRGVEQGLEKQRETVKQEYQLLQGRHNLKMAALKLSFLTPLLIVAGILFIKNRNSVYVWLVYALGVAVFVKAMVVMHEYFPARYFKYILILAALAVVLRILVYLLRMVAFPRTQWLLKQYREAYEAFFCPVCGYPIRRGPLKFAAWSRRSIRKLALAPAVAGSDKPYTCPACTTRLYEQCQACKAIRPSLLPACDACGAVKPLAEP